MLNYNYIIQSLIFNHFLILNKYKNFSFFIKAFLIIFYTTIYIILNKIVL